MSLKLGSWAVLDRDPLSVSQHVVHTPSVIWPEPGGGTAIHLVHSSARTAIVILELSSGHR